mmetsp:Transcript_14069/g.33720  ORF Transcript_14069/g.33720 Transcript_14069/m.33720 type:complete len:141 (-) Transcript_14069:357-779(-)
MTIQDELGQTSSCTGSVIVEGCTENPTVSPTTSPTGSPTCPSGPIQVAENKKCSVGEDRLFRTANRLPGQVAFTLQECHELCLTTDGCEYVSYGEEENDFSSNPGFVGVCIGCRGPSVPNDDQDNFNVYQVNRCTSSPTR